MQTEIYAIKSSQKGSKNLSPLVKIANLLHWHHSTEHLLEERRNHWIEFRHTQVLSIDRLFYLRVIMPEAEKNTITVHGIQYLQKLNLVFCD